MSDRNHVRDWWKTSVIKVEPGHMEIWGYPIEQLIGKLTFVQMIWLTVRGEVPTEPQAKLLEAALVASVDGGPMSPSCSIASMAITCGIGLNGAIASGINALGDTHGGAGQQCIELFEAVAARLDAGETLEAATNAVLDAHIARGRKILPGFGHRFHPVDPRSQRLLELATEAAEAGEISGRFIAIGKAIEASLQRRKGKLIPMNVDGAFAVILAELDFAAPLGRGVFVLSRAVGLLAHAWEQIQEGKRIKGPVPPDIMYSYVGPGTRRLGAGP